jgi:hypothetical protein
MSTFVGCGAGNAGDCGKYFGGAIAGGLAAKALPAALSWAGGKVASYVEQRAAAKAATEVVQEAYDVAKALGCNAAQCFQRAAAWEEALADAGMETDGRAFVIGTDDIPLTTVSGKKWLYHVAPVKAANGEYYVIDPEFFSGPVTVQQWQKVLSRGDEATSSIRL